MASRVDVSQNVLTQSPQEPYSMYRQPLRPRSLWGQISTALLQPATFFRALPVTRQWVWIALLVLFLVGFSATRRPDESAETAPLPTFEQPSGDVLGGEGVPPAGIGGIPPGVNPIAPSGGANGAEVSETTMTALLAAGGIVLAWLGQTLLLAEVSLFNGATPRFGRNMQIAIWASLPLALMALIQVIYYASGGTGGQMGVSLLLEQWPGYAELPPLVQALLLSLTSQITLFWLWSLLLLYVGARFALRGRWWSSALVVIAWVAIATLVPVLSGAVQAPTEMDESSDFSEAGGLEVLPEGGFSLDEAEGGSSDPIPALPRAPIQIAPGG